ncbi:MAG: V-type ATP synthase subunit K [Oscillospiraceae bacterium]|nr:V-type ATP synthase subunit K [Oscillospiraceae bacterium]
MADLLSLLGTGLAILGATLAVGLACFGAAKGSGIAGEASAGLLAEDPSKFSKAMILTVIPGTNGLYGLVTWFMVMAQIGLFTGEVAQLTLIQGLMFFAACVPMMTGGSLAAIAQGRVAAGAVGVLARQDQDWSKGMILCILIEFFSILCLLASFLTIISIPV